MLAESRYSVQAYLGTPTEQQHWHTVLGGSCLHPVAGHTRRWGVDPAGTGWVGNLQHKRSKEGRGE
jgi:hypothetical protein